MSDALYNTRILRLAAATAGLRRLPAPEATAVKVSPVCGSKVTADVVMDAGGDGWRFADVGLEPRACALGQAATVLVDEAIRGRSVREVEAARQALADWLAGRSEAAPDWPGMEVFAPARPHRARHPSILLAFDAALAAAEVASAGSATTPAAA